MYLYVCIKYLFYYFLREFTIKTLVRLLPTHPPILEPKQPENCLSAEPGLYVAPITEEQTET